MATDNVITYLLELEDKVSAELKKTSKNVDDLEGDLAKLREEQKKGAAADDRRAQALGAMSAGVAAAAAATAAFAAGMVAMGAHAISTSANLEAFETRLGGLLGGLDKGKARVQELFEISASTPFSITGLVEAEATLEAFGVNAPKVRQGVMDLAGAMGMDLNEAARGVGKALAAGAGAADVLREKGVIAMIEMDAGVKASEMSLQEFRQSLFETLDANEKLAGGTQRMSQTFAGLMSTLKDQFTVFSKQVGDAELFATAKATLKVILDLLGKNTEATGGLAAAVGGMLAKAMVSVVGIAFKIAAVIQRIREGWATVGQVVTMIRIEVNELHREFLQMVQSIAGGVMTWNSAIAEQTADIAELNTEFAKSADHVDDLRDSQDWLLKTGDETVSKITELAGQYQAAADAAKSIKPPEGSDEIMTLVGIDKDAAKGAKKAGDEAKELAKSIAKFGKEMDSLRSNFAKTAAATRKPLKESKQLQNALEGMSKDFQKAALTSIELGDEAMMAFDKVKDGMIASMGEMAAAIPKAKREETMAAVGAGMAAGVDVMETGGLGTLAAAGPVGGAAAGLIGVGQQGEAAFQEEVNQKAQEAADARQAEMQAKADAMKEKGYSEAEIEAAGLGADAIEEAGAVTPEDTAQAEAATDRDKIMAEQVKNVIKGVIDGVMAIMSALPEILSELIPMLLIDLPTALIEAIPSLIEELIPVLVFELPKAIILMLVKVVPKLLRMLFVDLPKAIFRGIVEWWGRVWNAIRDLFTIGKKKQTGGFVPVTSSYLLHQGERVVPASGAGSGTATGGLAAFNAGGRSLTVNTHVVDPDAIHGLGRLIDAELGPTGRATVPIWGSTTPTTSI